MLLPLLWPESGYYPKHLELFVSSLMRHNILLDSSTLPSYRVCFTHDFLLNHHKMHGTIFLRQVPANIKCEIFFTEILLTHIGIRIKCELPDVQTGFRKDRGTRDQIANICWIIKKKKESSRKTSISSLLTMPKPLTVWITVNCGKFWKRWEYQTTWPASWEICMQVRKQ